MKRKLIEEFLSRIPKSDLHVHLDGSLRISTLIELAKEKKVKLPSYTESGLKETVFKSSYKNLEEYLTGFSYTCAVLQDPESLERCAYELAMDNIAEKVHYLEVRFAPQLHINPDLPNIDLILTAVNRGLEKAAEEHNNSDLVKSGKAIPFRYGIIVGAMRFFNEHFSRYYAELIGSLPHIKRKFVFGYASLELAHAAVEARNKKNLPIVGLDLCGAEAGYPPDDHRRAYKYVHKNFLGKTVHAGEAYGPESIFQAITECHANRLGHGTFLFTPSAVKDSELTEPEKFSDSLAEYIARRRITIEACPTSNMQTIPDLRELKNHPIGRMIEKKISVTVCTDNRLVSSTTVTGELTKVLENFEITKKQLRDMIIAGFKGCFYYGTYSEHRAFVRAIIDNYNDLENELLDKYLDSDIVFKMN